MKKVACIVVTYNRLNLLKNCIKSIRSQTCKDFDVFVINNGSTDGTDEWLAIQSDINSINQENVGGAGGFYIGMKTAIDKGYDWVWMMDDDGETASTQLEELLKGASRTDSKFVNALVCNIKDKQYLAFGLVYNGVGLTTVVDAQNYTDIPDSINPFNGTMIHRNLIEKIGLIKKEMFIWGDEREYTYRAAKAGYKQYTITSALHFHPPIKSQQIKIFPFLNRFTVDVPANKSRAYIKYRNNGYLCHTYYPSDEVKEKIKYTLYFVSRFKFSELRNFFKYYDRGKKNLFDPISALK